MKVGETVKFDFAGKKKEGVVYKLFPNTVHLKVDFDKTKGKIVKRKLSALEGGKPKESKKSKESKKAKK